MNLSSPRGTRDFPPEALRLRTWLFGHFREVARLFAFEEYDAPVVESEELYTRKAGEEIVDQLYAFEDKSGRRLVLRPEITPSLARLVLQKGGSLALPIKWFSIPQCWRYERMTRGRRREHYQWNMDIFGVREVTAEAELLAAVATLFSRVGLSASDIEIRISSRRILQTVLDDAGVAPDQFAPVCILIDKLDKVPKEEIARDVTALGPAAFDGMNEIVDPDALRTVVDRRREISSMNVSMTPIVGHHRDSGSATQGLGLRHVRHRDSGRRRRRRRWRQPNQGGRGDKSQLGPAPHAVGAS